MGCEKGGVQGAPPLQPHVHRRASGNIGHRQGRRAGDDLTPQRRFRVLLLGVAPTRGDLCVCLFLLVCVAGGGGGDRCRAVGAALSDGKDGAGAVTSRVAGRRRRRPVRHHRVGGRQRVAGHAWHGSRPPFASWRDNRQRFRRGSPPPPAALTAGRRWRWRPRPYGAVTSSIARRQDGRGGRIGTIHSCGPV